MMEGELSVDEFIKDFLPKRTLAHLRRVKADKMRDLIRVGPSSGAAGCSTGINNGPVRPAPCPPGKGAPLWGNRVSAPRPPSYQWNYTGTV